jgi:uncharacterized membrane protein
MGNGTQKISDREPTNHPRLSFVTSSLFPLLLTILALLLRLYRLDYHDYWDDEIFTTLASRPPLTTIYLSLSSYCIHPPLYYMILHLWHIFGEDIVTSRMFSVLVGTLCVPALYWLGRLLISPSVGLLAAAMMTIAPSHIMHSQQARMYPLVALLVIVAPMLFYQAWKYGGWWRWLWCGSIVAMAFYVHVYAPFSILAFNVWALAETYWSVNAEPSAPIGKKISCMIQAIGSKPLRVRWLGLIGAQVFGLIAFLPFAPQMYSDIYKPIIRWLIGNGPFDWLPAFVEQSNGATLMLQTHGTIINLLGLTSLILATAAILLTFVFSVRRTVFFRVHKDFDDSRSMLVLLHALIWTPIVVSTVLSLTFKPILVPRYLIGIMPPLLLLMAWGAISFWHRLNVRILALGFAVSMVVGLVSLYPTTPQHNNRIEMSQWLVEQQQPGDAIAYTYWHVFDTMLVASPNLDNLYVAPGPVCDTPFWRDRTAYTQWHTPEHIQPVSEFAPRYRRVWLSMTIYDHDFAYHQQVDQRWLEEHGRLVEKFVFDDTTVFLYSDFR